MQLAAMLANISGVEQASTIMAPANNNSLLIEEGFMA